MRIGEAYLSEKKQKTTITKPDSNDETVILRHLRSINGKCYKVTFTHLPDQPEPEKVIETEMSEEEIAEFEKTWKELWNPKITEKEMFSLSK